MKCQMCHKTEATVRVSELQSDGTHKEIHLCEQCAKQYGVSLKFSFSEVLGNLISSQLGTKPGDVTLACPNCGLTFEEFQSGQRLGCPQDYETFKQNLIPLLERVQSGLQHVGKAPHNVGGSYRREREMAWLRRKLEKAVASEDYETAAKIRDDMRTIKNGGEIPEPEPDEDAEGEKSDDIT